MPYGIISINDRAVQSEVPLNRIQIDAGKLVDDEMFDTIEFVEEHRL
jgi:hypothetical protein